MRKGGAMRCPRCGDAVLVEINVTFTSGTFTMHACPSCERRWWDRDGHPVALERVLTAVAAA
jgi:transposase-like protein